MKILGSALIAVGMALLIYLGIHFLKENNRVLSPVPEDRGVKVIFITPSK